MAAESSTEVPILADDAVGDTLGAERKLLFWMAEETFMFSSRGMVLVGGEGTTEH